MTPHHHPTDQDLLDYATGAASSGLALLVAAHATLCPPCRARVADFEAAGGALLADLPPVPTTPGLEAALLARLDRPLPVPPPSGDPAGVLPAPLAARVGPSRTLAWRRVVPGIERVDVDPEGGPYAPRLFRLAPGLAIPPHRHTGTERTLVLAGGFHDNVGHYGRGDVSVLDDVIVHDQHIDAGDPCLALVVADGPLRPTTTYGRLLQWFARA